MNINHIFLFAIFFGLPVLGQDWKLIEEQSLPEGMIEITVPGDPDFLEPYDSESVWVIVPNKDAVELVSDDGVIASIEIPGPLGAMVYDFDSIWVSSEDWKQLVRIDTIKREITARIDAPIVEFESTLASADGSIWILTHNNGTLLRIDPESNSVSNSIQVRSNSRGLTAGFGSVWVSNRGPYDTTGLGSVQRIDPSSNQVIATIPVGPTPLFLTAGEGAVWVINQGDGTLSRIDPESNSVVATIHLGVEGEGGDIAVGVGRVWVRAEKTLLTVIDSKSNQILARYGPPAGSGAVGVADGSLWLSAYKIHRVWRIDLSIIP